MYNTDEQKCEEFANEIAEIIKVNLVAMTTKERWIARKAYAKLYGLSLMTIHRRTDFLLKNNAISGKGKAIRYDKFFNPNTGELTIPSDLRSM